MNPKLSRFFLFKTALMLIPLVSLTIYSMRAEVGFSGPVVIVSMLACSAVAFAMLWSAHKYQNTLLTDTGVEQATLSGKLSVRWEEVKRIRMYKKAYLLETARGTVLVYPHAYDNPAAVNDFVVGHLQRAMNDGGGKAGPKPGKKKSG